MKLNIQTLQDIGAFTGAPIEKEIKWMQGGKEFCATVYVRRLSYHSAVGDLRSAGDKTDPVAARIANSIVDENGQPVFTVADILGEANPERGPLSGPLSVALLSVITEVNNLGKPNS